MICVVYIIYAVIFTRLSVLSVVIFNWCSAAQVIDLGKSRPWFLMMPKARFEKIVTDCMTLSYKDAGLTCDTYDVIAVVWDNVAEYHDDIKKTLIELYSFANGVSGGSLAGFMFLSIVTNVIEVSDSLLGPLRTSLALEVSSIIYL